jgi:hypothetical protein
MVPLPLLLLPSTSNTFKPRSYECSARDKTNEGLKNIYAWRKKRMSEKKVSLEELLQRIDQVLNVLNMISKDLTDISKALKGMGGVPAAAAAAPPRRTEAIEDVRVLFPKDLEEMLEFEEKEEYIVIRPRRYLGSENFAKIASTVRGAGGEYVSAGKESHFRIPKGRI